MTLQCSVQCLLAQTHTRSSNLQRLQLPITKQAPQNASKVYHATSCAQALRLKCIAKCKNCTCLFSFLDIKSDPLCLETRWILIKHCLSTINMTAGKKKTSNVVSTYIYMQLCEYSNIVALIYPINIS